METRTEVRRTTVEDERPKRLQRFRSLGPGLLVTAAFIGPGTVTTASVTGASYGFALMWALVFSIAATMVLQEMSARLGVVSREGLGEALRTTFHSPAVRGAAILLVTVAIVFGNAAFETGNITGAAISLEAVTGLSPQLWAVIIGVAGALLLGSGAYKVIERVLVALVIVMSVSFLIGAIIVAPNLGDLFAGFVPTIPSGSMLTVIALVGTTVVPYNMFLHASSVQQKWPETTPTKRALAEARTDTILSIALGGLVTAAIVTTAASAFFESGTEITDATVMATQLEPLLGPAAKILFGVGLFAAGMTSTVTAPLAAAYALSGALGWERDLKSARFRGVWAIILVVGTVLAAIGSNPVGAILFAQAANGLLLPLIAIFLLAVMNRRDLLGDERNGLRANLLGGAIVLVTLGLGGYQIAKAAGIIEG